MSFDPEEFRHLLDAVEATEEDKDEMLQLLWRMMSLQADRAFGLDGVSLVCGQAANDSSYARRDSVNLIGPSKKSNTVDHDFNGAALNTSELEEKAANDNDYSNKEREVAYAQK